MSKTHPTPAEAVENALIWHKELNCPGIIHTVNEAEGTFQVTFFDHFAPAESMIGDVPVYNVADIGSGMFFKATREEAADYIKTQIVSRNAIIKEREELLDIIQRRLKNAQRETAIYLKDAEKLGFI